MLPEYLPAAQSEHSTDAPIGDEYLPSVHDTQLVLPIFTCTFPLTQSKQVVAPVPSEYFPDTQSEQSEDFWALLIARYVPAAQDVHATDFVTAANCPELQGEHAVLPSAEE